MDPFPLAALPDDELGCVLRATLAASGSTMEARGLLSLVCRRWRDSLRGAQPAHVVGSVGNVTQLPGSSSLLVAFGAHFLYVCPVYGQDRCLPSIRCESCSNECPGLQWSWTSTSQRG